MRGRAWMTLSALALLGSGSLEAMAATRPPAEGAAPRCRTKPVQKFSGRIATPARIAKLRRLAGADMARKLEPNSAPTMDFRPGRLNLHVDTAGIIVKLTCG